MAPLLRVGGGLVLAFVVSASAGAQTVKVSSAEPDNGAQGTRNLDVTIRGKGFAYGAVAHFLLTGSGDPAGVTVNGTTFVGPTRLVANIDIAEDATVGDFDIEVQAAGRTGKGIELFRVTTPPGNSGSPFLRWDFSDGAGDGIRSDGISLPPACGTADYADARDSCIPGHRTSSYAGSHGGAFLATRASQHPVATRSIVLDFSSAATAGSACHNLDILLESYQDRDLNATAPDADPDPCVDHVVVRWVSEFPFKDSAQFASLIFMIDGPDVWRTESGMQWNGRYSVEFANSLSVERVDADTVVLSTQPGLDQADLYEVRKGKDQLLGTYHMPFAVTVTRLQEYR